MIIYEGGELFTGNSFTGNSLLIIPLLEGYITIGDMLKSLGVVYVGNAVGSLRITFIPSGDKIHPSSAPKLYIIPFVITSPVTIAPIFLPKISK